MLGEESPLAILLSDRQEISLPEVIAGLLEDGHYSRNFDQVSPKIACVIVLLAYFDP